MNEYSFQVLDWQAVTGTCGRRILQVVNIGANLKRLREAAGLTQDTLGRSSGLKQSDISKWEQGQVPSVPSLLRLATALKVSVDVLLEGADDAYEAFRRVSGVTHEKIDEAVTQPVQTDRLSSALLVGEPYAEATRGTTDAESSDVRSPLNVAEELHAHATALTALALRIARDAGRAARRRDESQAVRLSDSESLPKRATGRRRKR